MELHALKSGYMLREYRIEKLLGEGGFGLTYLAFDTHLEKKVAIKEYMPSEHSVRQDDSKIVAKSTSSEKVYKWGLNAFLNEAKILAKFEDTNIVRIYRFFESNGTAYIVMEYCEGGCLVDLIAKNEHMPEQQLKKIVSAIVHGLQLVHNDGILHRDIKPDNIMFRENGTPVLIDFGAARQAIGDKSRKVTTIITPGYAPLEQYSSKGEIGPWSDIYSLAAVAYLCLTGEKPPDIMNRLHDDTIKKLGDGENSSAFLKSLDSALNLHVNDRPKNLSEWSKTWGNYKLDKTNTKPSPIFAAKKTNIGDLRIPISARSSIEADELTVVDYNSLNPDKKPVTSFLRIIIIVILTSVLVAAGYLGYEYYLNGKIQIPFLSFGDEKSKPEKQQQNLILKVQKQLNLLGYLVPENGVIDTRTSQSIKSFEEKNQLVITGVADEILLNLLKKKIKDKDDEAWSNAQSQNSKQSYKEYLAQNPNGHYADMVPQTILNLQLKKQKDFEEQKLQEQHQNQHATERLQQIAQLKSQLVKYIQKELKRLKFKSLVNNGQLDNSTKIAIREFQKLKNIEQNGLPTKTLLFQLKSEKKWLGRLNGEIFKDCEQCPTMVVVGAGSFLMGTTHGNQNSQPLHNVNIREFAIGQTEVTFSQWDACFNAGSCTYQPEDDKLGRGDHAVMRVNYYDAQQFINWLNQITKKNYRLPTEAEWEYSARAGTKTAYSWGEKIETSHVYCAICDQENTNVKINHVKNYHANPFGLFDMHGNVWEWTQDCWHANYLGAPSDGEAWEPNNCNLFVVRGGSGGSPPSDMRSAHRGKMNADSRLNSLGFRVARDLK